MASRTNSISGCPQFLNTEENSCYFLDRKYASLMALLRRRPPVSKDMYQAKVVKDWTQIRDELLSIKPEKPSATKNVTRPSE